MTQKIKSEVIESEF